MRKDFLFGIIATFLIMGWLFWQTQKNFKPNSSIEASGKVSPVYVGTAGSNLSGISASGPQVSATNDKPQADAAASSPEQVEIMQKKFADNLRTIATCLQLNQRYEQDHAEPSIEVLLSQLAPSLGDPVVQMEDWTQKDFKTPDGILKRIRTEMEYQDGGAPIKRVQLYHINEQGLPEMQSIDQELATNPTDEFLRHLEGEDSRIFLQENGGRVYYQEGEEVAVVERNGRLEALTITKGYKTVNCNSLDSTGSNCQCLE